MTNEAVDMEWIEFLVLSLMLVGSLACVQGSHHDFTIGPVFYLRFSFFI